MVAPRLPDSGWNVESDDAVAAFAVSDPRPAGAEVAAAIDWARACEMLGPPDDAVRVPGDERYLAKIAGTRVIVEYLVVPYEFYVVVRRFTV